MLNNPIYPYSTVSVMKSRVFQEDFERFHEVKSPDKLPHEDGSQKLIQFFSIMFQMNCSRKI